ncbi:hypothetical protein PLICRDRAFT_47442 [Plicaturopsis crispa FD-325 SS-3]|uniref:Uncharacterized protein n=1 Tax=Plicaturopsis crispa FD-325 SS-3 TaxID=944288 RepID=A0A0C9T1H1_PLICR|nr:hypothetical protein PLICRDRAFT_47442 [Plicaturopsis crispa FD-325 SS-3]
MHRVGMIYVTGMGPHRARVRRWRHDTVYRMILLTVCEHACKLNTTHSREETVQYPDTVVPRERRRARTNMDSSALSGCAGTPINIWSASRPPVSGATGAAQQEGTLAVA